MTKGKERRFNLPHLFLCSCCIHSLCVSGVQLCNSIPLSCLQCWKSVIQSSVSGDNWAGSNDSLCQRMGSLWLSVPHQVHYFYSPDIQVSWIITASEAENMIRWNKSRFVLNPLKNRLCLFTEENTFHNGVRRIWSGGSRGWRWQEVCCWIMFAIDWNSSV